MHRGVIRTVTRHQSRSHTVATPELACGGRALAVPGRSTARPSTADTRLCMHTPPRGCARTNSETVCQTSATRNPTFGARLDKFGVHAERAAHDERDAAVVAGEVEA